MPAVAICTAHVVIPALSAELVFNGESLDYTRENLVVHLAVCLLLLIQLQLRNITVVDWNQQERNQYKAVH
jgi:hypothetical protein